MFHTQSIYIQWIIVLVVPVVSLSISCSYEFSLILLHYCQYQSWWWLDDMLLFFYFIVYILLNNAIYLIIFCKIDFVPLFFINWRSIITEWQKMTMFNVPIVSLISVFCLVTHFYSPSFLTDVSNSLYVSEIVSFHHHYLVYIIFMLFYVVFLFSSLTHSFSLF